MLGLIHNEAKLWFGINFRKIQQITTLKINKRLLRNIEEFLNIQHLDIIYMSIPFKLIYMSDLTTIKIQAGLFFKRKWLPNVKMLKCRRARIVKTYFKWKNKEDLQDLISRLSVQPY